MRTMFLCGLFIMSMPLFAFESVEQKLERLENELLDLKLGQADSTSFKISGDFRTIYQSREFKNVNGQDSNKDQTVSELRINLDNATHDKVKFYSTVASTYFWNSNFQTAAPEVDDKTNKVKGVEMYVQKAYIDYFLNDKKFSFSIGRLPTQYGPPSHFSSNTPRQGTYPVLLYSVPLDGVAFTANLGRLTNSDKRYVFRLIYSPFNNTSGVSSTETVGVESPFSGLKTKNGAVYMANFETSGEAWGGGDFAFILQGYHARFGRAKSLSGVRGALQDSLPAGSIDRNVYEIGSQDSNIATISSLIAYLELTNVADSAYDLYGSHKKTTFKNDGEFQAVIIEDNNGGALGTKGQSFNIGGFLYDQDETGDSTLLGTRYKVSSRFNFGVEYLRQTKGDAPFGINTFSFSDVEINIGKSWRFYTNYKLEESLNVGFGVETLSSESVFRGLKYVDSESDTKTFFTSLRYSF